MRTFFRIMVGFAPIPRRAVTVLGFVLLALAVYWPSVAELWAHWFQSGGTNQYGMLIAGLSISLLYRSRFGLAAAPVKPVSWVLPVLVVLSAGTMLFWRAGIETLQLALLPPLLLLAVVAGFGTRIARVVAFPIGFLYFGLPGWGVLWPSLQQLTLVVVNASAHLVGLPARVSGDLVTLPGAVVFEVGSKCSGIEFFVVGLAVAALIGELERAALKRRVWLMALMGAIAIISNWIRVFSIIAIGYASNMHNALATSKHLLFGWIIFAAALLAYLWLAPRAARQPAEVSSSATGPASSREPWVKAGAVAAVAALIAFPAYVYGTDLIWRSGATTMTLEFPNAKAPWRGPLPPTDPLWQPQFGGAHFERRVEYRETEGRSVEALAVGYTRQAQGHELVNEENSLVGKRGLTVVDYAVVTAGGQRFRTLTARDHAGQRSIIWWLYDIGGRRFATPVYSELWYGLEALIHPPYSILYAFRTVCEPSCRAARTTLTRFIGRNSAHLFMAAHDSRPNFLGNSA